MVLAQLDIEICTQKLVLDSSLRNIGAVERVISGINSAYDLSPDLQDRIWLVLHEAVTNAIRHGNKCDLSKKVTLTVEEEYGRYLCFTIQDEGDGFDPGSVPDPTSPERIEEPNGRGVFLMKRMADQLNYSETGNVVEIRFNLFPN